MLQLAVDWAGVATMASTTRRVLEDIWDTTTTTLGATAAAAYGRVGQVVGVGGGIDAVSEHYTVDRVWPHAQKQHGQADVMLQRLQGWQAIIGGLTAYFDELARVEMLYGQSQQRLAAMLAPGRIDYAPLSASLMALHDYTDKVAAKHANLGHALLTEPNRILAKLKQCINEDVQKITSEIIRLQAALRLARQETLLAMAAYERAYWSSEASLDHATGDPWLTHMVLHAKVAKLAEEEHQFNTSMLSFHAELAKIDAFLMENAQNILTTFAEWNGTLDNDIYRTNERVGTYAADIRPKGAFAAFAETHKLDDVDVWRQPVKPVQYSYANGPLARIVMDGMMLRQAGTVSTFWRTCYVVLTECGFLHCYDADAPLTTAELAERMPQVSMSVRHATVDTPQNGRVSPMYLMEVTAGNASSVRAAVGMHRVQLQLRSIQDLVTWVKALKHKAAENRGHAIELSEQHTESIGPDGELNDEFVVLSVADRRDSRSRLSRRFSTPEDAATAEMPPPAPAAPALQPAADVAGEVPAAAPLDEDDADHAGWEYTPSPAPRPPWAAHPPDSSGGAGRSATDADKPPPPSAPVDSSLIELSVSDLPSPLRPPEAPAAVLDVSQAEPARGGRVAPPAAPDDDEEEDGAAMLPPVDDCLPGSSDTGQQSDGDGDDDDGDEDDNVHVQVHSDDDGDDGGGDDF